MLKNEKILVTGVTGNVGPAIAEFLAKYNEVWGLARFLEESGRSDQEVARAPSGALLSRADIEAKGIKTCRADLAAGDFSEVPTDFTYVLHFAYARVPPGPDQFDIAFRTNGDGTGLLMQHCCKAKAFLLVSSPAIYSPHEDPYYAYKENDPLGRAWAPWAPSSPASKLMQESVASFCSRAFNLPTTIARLNLPWGMRPSIYIEMMQRGEKVVMPHDPYPYSLTHIDDMCWQLEALLDAASTPALTVNWGGDDVVTVQDWCRKAGEILHIEPEFGVMEIDGAHRGFVADLTKFNSIVEPSKMKYDDVFRDYVLEFHG